MITFIILYHWKTFRDNSVFVSLLVVSDRKIQHPNHAYTRLFCVWEVLHPVMLCWACFISLYLFSSRTLKKKTLLYSSLFLSCIDSKSCKQRQFYVFEKKEPFYLNYCDHVKEKKEKKSTNCSLQPHVWERIMLPVIVSKCTKIFFAIFLKLWGLFTFCCWFLGFYEGTVCACVCLCVCKLRCVFEWSWTKLIFFFICFGNRPQSSRESF